MRLWWKTEVCAACGVCAQVIASDGPEHAHGGPYFSLLPLVLTPSPLTGALPSARTHSLTAARCSYQAPRGGCCRWGTWSCLTRAQCRQSRRSSRSSSINFCSRMWWPTALRFERSTLSTRLCTSCAPPPTAKAADFNVLGNLAEFCARCAPASSRPPIPFARQVARCLCLER